MTDQSLNIVIKTVNNEVYNICVNRTSRVDALKAQLLEITSVAVNRQRLIYRGRVLQDDTTLQEYNIEEGHTVHMVARPVNFQELQQAQVPVASSSAANNSFARVGAAPQQVRLIAPAVPAVSASNGDEANTMEHIRQSLLTLHTLISTIDSGDVRSTVRQSYSEEYGPSQHLPGNDATTSSLRSASVGGVHAEEVPLHLNAVNNASLSSAAERQFFVGQWVDVKDTVQQWLEATIMNINQEQKLVFVHYNGWPDRWDEWIAFDSPRIAPFRSRTAHSTLTPYLSPSPNVSLARAPITGANDIRTLLPEVVRMFRVLQPVIESAAALAEESLLDRPTVSAYTTGRSSEPTGATSFPTASAGSTGPYRRNRSADAPAERSGPGQVASTAPPVAATAPTAPPASPLQSARIAPGMPWEHAGSRRSVQEAALRSRAPAPRESTNPAVQQGQRVASSSASGVTVPSGSPYDRRQRLRYADYDPTSPPASPSGWSAAQGGALAPGFSFSESSSSSESAALDFSGLNDSASGSEDYGATLNNRSGKGDVREREGVITRKRSAEAAENEADDSGLPCTNDLEENAKMSADQESKEAPTEAETEAERAVRVAERDQRLRGLAQELCPLVDRFGRVLADIAPHLWELGDMDAAAAGGAPGGQSTVPSAPDNNPYHFETSLLNLLRDRPPSPPPRRAYRTPIAMQTRIGGAVGVGGMGSLGLGLLGGPSVRNGNLAFLNDLGLLGGDTGAQGPSLRSPQAANAGTGAANRQQVDIHIAFVQPSNAARPSAEQDRAALLSSTILQAQMAQNLSARAQLLSNRTQELNNYSVAIEELLRSISGGSGASAGAGSSTAAPTSGPGSSTTNGAASHGSSGRTTGRSGRRYGSSIMPGSSSSSGARNSTTIMEYEPYDVEGESGNDEEDGEMSQDADQPDEEAEEEESEPLNDLLPSLSFNELGQSLMDLRAGRQSLAQEQRELAIAMETTENPEVEMFRGSWPDGSSSPTASFRSRSRNASAASADRTSSPVHSSSSRQHSSASAHEEGGASGSVGGLTVSQLASARPQSGGSPGRTLSGSSNSGGPSSSSAAPVGPGTTAPRTTTAADAATEQAPRTMLERLRRSFSFIP